MNKFLETPGLPRGAGGPPKLGLTVGPAIAGSGPVEGAAGGDESATEFASPDKSTTFGVNGSIRTVNRVYRAKSSAYNVAMKIIIGLGNPDRKYQYNRHNVGHMFIDSVKQKEETARLIKTNTFMNNSGEFVKDYLATNRYPLSALCVVHDDLDLRLGTFKIQFATGPKIHYGLQSIEQELGTKDFWRVRIGVDNRDPDNRALGEEYVLEDFSKDELETLGNLFPKIWEELTNKLSNSVTQ